MKIVTWNLRCAWNQDGINSFIHRAGFIFQKIKDEKPDIIGFQEVIEKSLELLQKMLPEYIFIGQFRSTEYNGEGLYTAIRKDTMELLGLETIWLSPTPYIAGSIYEGQSPCPRICVMTQIRNKNTGEIIRVYNTHLDYISEKVALMGAKDVIRFIEEYDKKITLPIVLMGDFNVKPNGATIKECKRSGKLFDLTEEMKTTYHNYGRGDAKIDYIFVSKELVFRVEKAETWTDCHEGIYLSDHYPLCAIFN